MRYPSATSNPSSGIASIPCYHCGEAVPAGTDYAVTINGDPMPMCCPGCQAVAQLISSNGLENFYQHRTALNRRPDLSETETPQHFLAYNDPDINRGFTHIDDQQIMHVRLLLGGIACAACTWLIEQTMLQQSGVKSATVNLDQSRLDVSIDTKRLSLAEVFQRVEELGYKARPFQRSSQLEQMASEHKTNLRQLAVAGLGMMQVGMFAIALHAGDLQGMETEYRTLLRWVSLLITGFVVGYSARGFFESAWRHLKVGALIMDLPVAMAIGLAFAASVWATITGGGQVYFDSVVMFTFFLLLGRFLERRARGRHNQAWFDAESNLPAAVKAMRGGQWLRVARPQLTPGETILIPPGEAVAVDATVLTGTSDMDERTFNGEPRLRAVIPGDTVYAGTVNASGVLQARVLVTYADSRLAALQRSVERGQDEKPALAKLADKIAARFIAFILVVTAATAVTWLLLDPSEALWICLSVLVISCPCALALATPAALTAAANGLRRAGVIVHGENAIEALSRTTHLIFDKTGTLTRGRFELSEVIALDTLGADELSNLAASLQAHSSHPLARAFTEIVADKSFEQVHYHIGEGLEGVLDAQTYRLGSQKFCRQIAPQLGEAPNQNCHWIALCRGPVPLAWFGLGDELRSEAPGVIADAIQHGLQVELLSGDSSNAGAQLADTLGIPTAHCGFSPQEKMAYVQQLQQGGAIVAMVGDGLNDAPVLSVADASFAVANSTELARTQADFILAADDLGAVLRTWASARRARAVIRQNLGWALAYNLCGIPLAAAGYVPPWMAAIGMSASSLLVVLNSLRLNRPQSN